MSHSGFESAHREVKSLVDEAKRLARRHKSGVITMWRRAISKSAAVLGKDHDTTTYSRLQLSKVLLDKDMKEEALQVALECESYAARTMASNNDLRVPMLSQIADCYQALGRFEEAATYWQASYDASFPHTGDEHGTAIFCRQRLANCLLQAGRFQEAHAIAQSNLAACKKVFGAHERTLFILIDAAKCAEKAGDMRDAFKRWHEAEAMSVQLPSVSAYLRRFCSKSAWHHRRLRRLKNQGKEFAPSAGESPAPASDSPAVELAA